MRYSNTTLKELTNRYKHVLLKCAYLNVAIIAGAMMATPAMAASIPGIDGASNQTGSKTHAGGMTILYADDVTIGNDVVYDNNINTLGAAGGIKALNGFDAGTGLTVSNNQGLFGGGLYIRLADDTVAGSPTKRDITIGENSVFSGNKATNGLGGAIGLESAGTVTIENGAKFTGNSATTDGGAIAAWTDASNNVGSNPQAQGSNLVLGKTIFENNTAGNRGGAIANLDDDKTDALKNTVTVGAGSSFTGNTANKGGAIYNEGDLTVSGATFENNSASVGGALYNDEGGAVSFAGNNTFKNNSASGVSNDIFNNGTINNAGNLFLTSGLVNNGAFTNTGSLSLAGINEINSAINNTGGTITFDDGSSIKTSLMNGTSMITGAGTVTGSTNLVIGNNSDMNSVKVEGTTTGLKFNSNALYDIVKDTDANDGTYNITKKSSSQVADSLAGQGVNNTQATTIFGMTEAKPTSAQGQAIADAITTAIQAGDTAGATKLVDAVNPTSAPVVQTQAVGTAAQVMNVASSRMAAAGEGRSGGSMADFAYGPWIQGLYNKTHNSQGAGFDGYSQGFAAGVDVDVTDSTMLGVAYAYTATDINSNGRKTKVYGDNYMIYGKYQPSEWYVDGSLNYGHGAYHENALGLKSKYNVDTYGGQALVGYQTGIFDNYAGARYVYVTPEKYSNGLTEVDAKNSQVGTAIIGTKISKEYKYQGVVWKPEFRLAATYDVKSDNSSSNVSIVGGNTTYTVNGKRLSRGAIQPGLGLKATVNNLDVVLGYDAELRSEQVSQTGTLKLQYNF